MTETAQIPDTATRFALESLLTEFAWRVDHGQADRVHELFVEEGTITGPGWTVNGRAEIGAEFGKRALDTRRLSRHLWSNPRFEILQPTRVRVSTIVQTFIYSRENDEQPPVPNTQFVVGDSTDVMRFENGQWLFESRCLEVLFVPRD